MTEQLILGKYFPLRAIIPENIPLVLCSIRQVVKFDKNKRPTDELDGYKLEVMIDYTFQRFYVKIPLSGLAISADELNKYKLNKKHVNIQLQNAQFAIFFDSKEKKVFESIKADGFKVIQQ